MQMPVTSDLLPLFGLRSRLTGTERGGKLLEAAYEKGRILDWK